MYVIYVCWFYGVKNLRSISYCTQSLILNNISIHMKNIGIGLFYNVHMELSENMLCIGKSTSTLHKFQTICT